MRHKKLSWFERFTMLFDRQDPHHRICRHCHMPIRKKEHWHQVKVGWFAPFYAVEHNDCKHPTAETPCLSTRRAGPELPFDDVPFL
jgi:hypothetical protein